MSNKKEWEKKMDRERAAHLLMVEFVKNNADVVAICLEPFVGLYNEVSYECLKDDMSVVNQVFAGIALQLIDHNSSLDPDDPDNMVLPVGAQTMSSCIEELTKFLNSTRMMFFYLTNKYDNDPAIEMAKQAFFKYEPQM